MNGEFDWVGARTRCSVLRIFNELRIGVEEDLKRINSTPRPEEYSARSFAMRTNTLGDYFVVFQTENANIRVDFNCELRSIKVTNGGDKEFSITLTLNNEGRCKLRLNGGEELEQWQVRRMMLEELFFGPQIA